MKKLLSVILTGSLAIGTLTGCGSADGVSGVANKVSEISDKVDKVLDRLPVPVILG